MELNWTDNNDIHILKVSGNLDSNTAPEMTQLIETRLKETPTNLVIDFSGVDYISSAGLRVIIKTHHTQTAADNKMILCGLKDYVHEVFEMSGLLKLFDIRENLESVLS